MDTIVGGAGADSNGSGTRTGLITFDRNAPGLTGIAVRGVLLSLVTFGIYRFWYITELRRFFWNRTIVDSSPGEYTGRGMELFLGFLVALAILIPLYVVLFGAGFAVPAIAPYASVLSFLALFVLGQYAIYRGRRYRATRTLWRGIRLAQDGSGFVYAGRAICWWLLTILTLGLAFPYMRASLERYRLRHTLIGESRLESTARGAMVLMPWLLLYAVAFLPIILAGLAFFVAADFSFPTDLFIPDPDDPGEQKFNPDYADTPIALWGMIAMIVAAISFPLAILLFPLYRARETRAFMNATHLGAVRLTSTLKARQFYWPYIVYFLSILAFIVVLSLVAGIAAAIISAGGGSGWHWLLVIGGVLFYLGLILLFAVLHVRVVQAGLWAAVATTTVIENVDALNAILASNRRVASGLNEGLADALDVGGALEIGF